MKIFLYIFPFSRCRDVTNGNVHKRLLIRRHHRQSHVMSQSVCRDSGSLRADPTSESSGHARADPCAVIKSCSRNVT